MKLAIHNEKGWNIKWISYCEKNNIPYQTVNCYDTDIISQIKKEEITHLMWHFHHAKPKDILMARNVLFSAAQIGIKVFPDFNTSWHFDDKVSQKYLLEAVDAPMVASYAFYNKEEALQWLKEKAKYPLVAKLRRGAGSYNVRLLRSFSQAKQYTKNMFTTGVHPTPGMLADTKNKLKVAGDFKGILRRLKKLPGFFKMVQGGRMFPVEKGYVYFQEFIPDNKEDLRIGITKDHVWGVKRKVRENDFRASGSGMFHYDLSDVPLEMVGKLYEVFLKCHFQSMAFDLVRKPNGEFVIVEISYGFLSSLFYNAPGYWNANLEFIEKVVYPEHAILENFLK